MATATTDRIRKIKDGNQEVPEGPASAGFWFDEANNKLKINPDGTVYSIPLVASSNGAVTTLNVGAANGATVSAAEYGDAFTHKTVLTLTALPLTLVDADGLNGAGVKIYDFPQGSITILSAQATIRETTTSAILTTLNGGKNLSVGVGTTTHVNATLATTEQDIVTAFTVVSSTVINVAGASATKVRTAAAATFDGTVTPIDAFFNVGVPTDGDIDADATTTYTGTVTINWTFNS